MIAPVVSAAAPLAGLAFLGALFACGRTPSTSDGPVDAIDSLFTAFDHEGMPGAAVVVIRDGQVLVRKTYGLADVDSGTAITPDTNFRLASLSKAFTAAAVLLLVEDGRLALDDPASRVLAELPAYASDVTVRHLLTHTSGLWDYEDFVPDTQARQVKDIDALNLVAARAESLYFTPGAEWRYSNTGYALLALIVERVEGERYAPVLQRRIFEPLGMRGTVAFEEGVSSVSHRAYGHRVRGDSVRRTDQSNTSAVLGDGGVYSSIHDLILWDAALSAGTLIPASLWREATTPFRLSDGRATEYGYGWFIDRFEGRVRHRHHGETRGFTHSIYRFPEERLTTIVLTNRSESAPWEKNDDIARRHLEQAAITPDSSVRGR
jgi:CubicO group peptidase (beta-lactamase class C family)